MNKFNLKINNIYFLFILFFVFYARLRLASPGLRKPSICPASCKVWIAGVK